MVADFIVEFTNMEGQGASVHMNGSSNKQAGGTGVVLYSLEYEALVARLDLTNATGATIVIVYCGSQVVTSQVNGKEMSRRAVGQIRLGSHGRERESQSPYQSRLSGTHAYP